MDNEADNEQTLTWLKGNDGETYSLPLAQTRPTSWVFLSDIHWPHTLYMDAVLKALSDFPVDYLILGGDILNMDPFNHWAKKSRRKARHLPDAKKYYKDANKELFLPLRQAVGYKTQIVYMLGNHEEWAVRATNDFPNETLGYVEVENNIASGTIDAWVNYRDLIRIGNLHMAHGDNIKYGTNPCQKMISKEHVSIMFGHYHSHEEISALRRPGQPALCAISVPCLAYLHPLSYGYNQPDNRSGGFAYGWTHQDGTFNYQVANINANGKFNYKGKWYEAKQTRLRDVGYNM